MLLALVMACGDPATTPTSISIPEPTPDIEATVQERLRTDATVEARIEEKQAEEAALKATAQAIPGSISYQSH